MPFCCYCFYHKCRCGLKGGISVKRQAHYGGKHSPTGKLFSGTSRPNPRNLVHGQMRGGIRL